MRSCLPPVNGFFDIGYLQYLSICCHLNYKAQKNVFDRYCLALRDLADGVG
jgi:hypothetical protein